MIPSFFSLEGCFIFTSNAAINAAVSTLDKRQDAGPQLFDLRTYADAKG